MKTKLLKTMLVLFMLTLGLDGFAQANRERSGGGQKVYVKNEVVHCTCGTVISKYTYKDSEYTYKCPNLKCRKVWSIKLDTGGAFGTPKLYGPKCIGRYELQEETDKNRVTQKHKCGKSCVEIIPDKTNNTIVIKRIGTCNELIYIAFPYIHKSFSLPPNCKEDGFTDEYGLIRRAEKDPTGIQAFITNDKNDFHKRYGNYGFIK